jgi:hypothetical protein
MRKVIHRKRWSAASTHIRPQPSLLHVHSKTSTTAIRVTCSRVAHTVCR